MEATRKTARQSRLKQNATKLNLGFNSLDLQHYSKKSCFYQAANALMKVLALVKRSLLQGVLHVVVPPSPRLKFPPLLLMLQSGLWIGIALVPVARLNKP
jgi:hypothetical protein